MKESRAVVRIKDIAEAAGVSLSTASNVLSGKRQVETEAGQRVLQCARELNYSRIRSTSYKKNVRFVLYRRHGRVIMDTPFFSELISGIDRACRLYGYSLSIQYVDRPSSREKEILLQKLISDDRSPMLLLATEMHEDDLRPFLHFNAPLMVLDSQFKHFSLDMVVMDNYLAGCLAARRFMEAGHRSMGLVTSSLPFNNALERQRGFEDTLSQAGIALAEENVFHVVPTMDDSAEEMNALLAARTRELPSAIFCINDILAFGAYKAFQARGCSVPGDVSVIGMDDMPFCRMVQPALSTISVPKDEIAQTAVARLVQRAETEGLPASKTLVGVSLVNRESVLDRNQQ